MFVSILQLMGFPVRSAAPGGGGENPQDARARPDNQGITATDEGVSFTTTGRPAGAQSARESAAAARRQDVKPQPKAVAKAQKPAAKARPAAKPVPKSAAKAPAKNATAKPAAKSTPAKASAKAAPAKKVPAKAPAKTAAKAPMKAAATTNKPATAAKAVTPPKSKTPAAPATPAKVAGATLPAPAQPSAAAAPRAMPPRPDAATVSATPARAVKPSARLAQITVPSMAQSVASTAAKASYTQTMPPTVLIPPPLASIKKDARLANNWKSKAVDELSDAEVLAMPDAEYMNDKQMAFFRLKLAQLKQDILNSAGETTEHLREDTVIVPDPADRATIEEEHALELRTRDRERKLLKKIEQSIARIDAGDYGYCDETGEPIGVGRLLARPTATLSLEAQQRRELKQKMFGD
jgi:DnaK suppressor protein